MRGMTVVAGKTFNYRIKESFEFIHVGCQNAEPKACFLILKCVCMSSNFLWSRYISKNAMLYILPIFLVTDCILLGIFQYFQGLFFCGMGNAGNIHIVLKGIQFDFDGQTMSAETLDICFTIGSCAEVHQIESLFNLVPFLLC